MQVCPRFSKRFRKDMPADRLRPLTSGGIIMQFVRPVTTCFACIENRLEKRPAQLHAILPPEQRLVTGDAVLQNFFTSIQNQHIIFLVIGQFHGHRPEADPVSGFLA